MVTEARPLWASSPEALSEASLTLSESSEDPLNNLVSAHETSFDDEIRILWARVGISDPGHEREGSGLGLGEELLRVTSGATSIGVVTKISTKPMAWSRWRRRTASLASAFGDTRLTRDVKPCWAARRATSPARRTSSARSVALKPRSLLRPLRTWSPSRRIGVDQPCSLMALASTAVVVFPAPGSPANQMAKLPLLTGCRDP